MIDMKTVTLEALKPEFLVAVAELERCEAHNTAQQESISKLSGKYSRLAEERELLRQRIVELEDQINKMRHEVAASNDDEAFFRSEAASWKRKATRLKRELKAATGTNRRVSTVPLELL